MTVLEVDGVTYAYPGADRPSLDGLTLSVAPGELVVVAGGTGSGKSTLLRAAAGLVPHFHGGRFAGSVAVAGLDSRDYGPAEVSAHAGSLFQDPETQVIMGTVRAELAFPLENRGWGGSEVARGVEEAALALGIGALLDRATHELSGGELQRVALGAAIAGRPELLLLDEPTSQLDPVAGDELLGVLRRLNEEHGTAILIAEHRLERCLAAADRVLALHDGRLAFDGSPGDFLEWAPPELQTPVARMFSLAGRRPLPVSVKEARAAIPAGVPDETPNSSGFRQEPPSKGAALEVRGAWVELRDGPAILRGATLKVAPGEAVALMGRNGAGKSTLLRVAAGLTDPTRGRVHTTGRVALLLQNPGDYFLHDTVAAELGGKNGSVPDFPAGKSGTEAFFPRVADRHPRDLSGGERQLLALEIVLGGERPAAVLLDEPTRGMDRLHKHALAERLRALAAEGVAVVVATHDADFAAEVAPRTVLLAEGAVIADGPTAELLTGGWYFATQVARVLPGVLTPEDGAALLAEGVRPLEWGGLRS